MSDDIIISLCQCGCGLETSELANRTRALRVQGWSYQRISDRFFKPADSLRSQANRAPSAYAKGHWVLAQQLTEKRCIGCGRRFNGFGDSNICGSWTPPCPELRAQRHAARWAQHCRAVAEGGEIRLAALLLRRESRRAERDRKRHEREESEAVLGFLLHRQAQEAESGVGIEYGLIRLDAPARHTTDTRTKGELVPAAMANPDEYLRQEAVRSLLNSPDPSIKRAVVAVLNQSTIEDWELADLRTAFADAEQSYLRLLSVPTSRLARQINGPLLHSARFFDPGTP